MKGGDSFSMKHLGQFPRGLYKATFGARRKVRDLSLKLQILVLFIFCLVVLRSRVAWMDNNHPICFVLKHAKTDKIFLHVKKKFYKKNIFCKKIFLQKKIFEIFFCLVD